MKKTDKESGFTLVEMVIAMPVAILIVVTLFSLALNSYFTITKNNARTILLLEGQNMLFKLEDELLFATEYGEEMKSDLSDPHDPSGGWDFDTDPNTLIIYETALTAGRRDPDREFVYKQVYNCSSSYNPIAIDNVIYFTEPNENNDRHTLYRRVLTGQYNTCGTNYRGQTCPTDDDVGQNGCVKTDALLSDNVIDFSIDYFDEDNQLIDLDAGGSPLDGEKVTVSLLLGQNVFGELVTAETELTLRKIN